MYNNPFSNPFTPNYSTPVNKNVRMKTTVIKGGKEYNVYRTPSGEYYYDTGNSSVWITDSKITKSLAANKAMCIDLGTNKAATETKKESVAPAPVSNTGGGYSSGGGSGKTSTTAYKEPEKPREPTAQELADLYGIDYNEANILRDYNEATNTYYDTAISKQQQLRNDYARNNAVYTNDIVKDYLKSYENVAPTAVGQGSLAANALSAQINADVLNSQNDYGMLESINTYQKAREAELAGNSDLARQYYNQIGTYLSALSAEKNKSDVQQYVDQLDAYGTKYSADRELQGYEAQAAASKYSGLANAAANKASSATGNVSAYDQLYNYYLTSNGGNSKNAYNSVNALLKAKVGS